MSASRANQPWRRLAGRVEITGIGPPPGIPGTSSWAYGEHFVRMLRPY